MSENPSGNPATTEVATLGGGCFWCLEAVYDELKGVISVESGYMGGKNPHPTYEQVCGGGSGHAEVVQVTFDPAVVSFKEILEVFFVIHDPTTLNRQGNDSGTQYRSTVFAQNPEQERIARAYIAQLDQERIFGKRIATTIELNKPFFDAEAYHQDYLTLNPEELYIVINDLPKVGNLKSLFPRQYRAEPVLVGKIN